MPLKDLKTKEAIESVLGTTRLGRKKVIVKVLKSYPELSASKIRRVYQNEGFSLWKRVKKRRWHLKRMMLNGFLSTRFGW